ncbi:hypothetical protein VaNZ11_001492 [Volvox africanus]|uniref:Uncharacterized protein n=1 Tax=Volvox africanus TaxID=51714 RepID=A0ABQ5RRD0_9CHLO|nr:hypothetical protein VaNZ11_001492 [Volvox africanus]
MLRATQARAARRVGVCEQIISVSLFVVGLISYQQFAAPYCAGLPHTLPAASQALAGYPCASSGFQRTIYVLRKTPYVLYDIVRLKFADRWATIAILALAVRMVAAFTMPSHLYGQLAAPLTMYVERAIMPTFHIFLGPKHHPSTTALKCMFNTYPVFDVAFFTSLLGVWDVSIAVEVTHCLLAALAHTAVCYWHRDAAPGGPANLSWVLFRRFLAMLTTLYLAAVHSTSQGRRGRASHLTSGRPATDSTAVATGSHAFGAPRADSAAEKADGELRKPTRKEVEEKQQRDELQQQGAAGGGVEGTAASCPGSISANACLEAAAGQQHLGPSSTVEGAARRGRAQAGGEVDEGAVLVPAPTAPTGGAAEAAGATPPGGIVKLKSYRSPIRRTMVRVKIPWAEPEQLTPGFPQRLADLAAQRGLVLRGAYVRSGCVEVVLVLEALLHPALPPPSPSPHGIPKNCRQPNIRISTSTSIPFDGGEDLEIPAIIRALGLEPPTPTQHQQHSREEGRTGGHDGSGVTAQSRRLSAGGGAEHSLGDDGSGGSESSLCCAVLVRSLLPRVLPLSLPSPMLPGPDASATHGSVYETVSAPPPSTCTCTTETAPVAALLQICVSSPPHTHPHLHPQQQQRQQPLPGWRGTLGAAPAEEEPQSIEVVVRSCGRYLPARVAKCSWVVDKARGGAPSQSLVDADGYDAVPDRLDVGEGCGVTGDPDGSGGVVGCPEGQCDVELLAAPPAPGLVLIEVRRLRRGADNSAPLRPAAPGFPGITPHGASDVTTPLSGPSPLHPDDIDLVPVLATDDAAIAEELNGLVSSWPSGTNRELDELVYDLGTWMAAAAAAGTLCTGDAVAATPPATAAATATRTSAAGSDPWEGKEVQGGEEAGGDAAMLAVLGPHLLQFAESAGLAATAASIRKRMGPPPPPQQQPRGIQEPQQQQQQQPQPDVDEEHQSTNKTSGPAAKMAGEGDECSARCLRTGFGGRSEVRGGRWGRADGGLQLARLVSALLQVLGLHTIAPSSPAAYDTFAEAWCVAQGHTVQLVESLALITMLLRAGRSGLQPMGPTTIVCVMGCGIGALTTLARLVLPYRSWVRLARAVQIPRYLGHTGAKVLVALGFSAPLGMVTYTTGAGALLLEGLVLPGASLISFRWALIVAAIKLPANVAMMLVLGATRTPLIAVLLAARIEALALTTTIACNVYMRLACERHITAAAAAAATVGAGGGAGGAAPLTSARRSSNSPGDLEEYVATLSSSGSKKVV